jgi:pilus assembly protein CpaC
VNGVPGFLTRKSETEINVKSGQTMVISGLISRDMQHSTISVPGLGSIPILGHLFRSDSDVGNRTDLLIAVTPVVVDANSSMNRERIQKSQDMKERFERNLSKQDFAD